MLRLPSVDRRPPNSKQSGLPDDERNSSHMRCFIPEMPVLQALMLYRSVLTRPQLYRCVHHHVMKTQTMHHALLASSCLCSSGVSSILMPRARRLSLYSSKSCRFCSLTFAVDLKPLPIHCRMPETRSACHPQLFTVISAVGRRSTHFARSTDIGYAPSSASRTTSTYSMQSHP